MNKLWLVVGFTVAMLSSCITAAQYNNAEDDVYYSPKASNRKAPVMIPDVDVDEIIKKNPPQYGEPSNRIDDVTTNPYAAIGYPAYKAEQDSLYKLHPELSGYYVNPNLPNSQTDEQARRLRRISSGSNWYGYNSYNSWGWPSLSVGYGWGNYGRYGYGYNYNPWYSGWNIGWNSNYGWNLGWNSGWGCGYNNWGYPYYGYGYGCYPYSYYNNYWPYYGYGYGYYNNPYYWGYPYYYGSGSSSSGGSDNNSNPMERPRPSVGSNNPPATGTGMASQNGNMVRSATSSGIGTGLPATNENPYMNRTLPANSGTGTQPAASPYTPPPGSARLDNINGRQVYTPPAPPVQQQPSQPSYGGMQPPSSQPAMQPSQRDVGGQQQYSQPSQPMFSNPSPMPSSPPSGGGGGGRSVGGGGGSHGGGGGVQRPR